MSSGEIHRQKYEMFRRDAENETISIPTRIQAYFNAAFHLLEWVVFAVVGAHIERHQRVRRMFESHSTIFGEQTRTMWENFQELENRIRPGQIYGGSINGENLRSAREIFYLIETAGLEVLHE